MFFLLFFFVVVVADVACHGFFFTMVSSLAVRLRLHALTANRCTLSGLAGHRYTFAGYGRKCAIELPIDDDMRSAVC